MKKSKKIKSIMIIGKRWFDKVNGNTYCSSRVYINGEYSFSVPWQYGYGSYYEQAAKQELEKRGITKVGNYDNGVSKSFWSYCNDNKIKYETVVTDGLKRDMVTWGENK